MKRALAVLLLGLVLPGCSWVAGIVGGEDNSEPPVPLTKLEDPLPLRKLWSKGIGVGYEKQFLKLVPAVADGQLVIADRKGRVLALDALTGEENWEVKTEVPVSAGPGAGEGLVLLGTSDAEVLALDAADGSKRWAAAVSSEVLAVPQIDLGRVIVQTVDGNITALDADTGAQLWIYDRSVPVLTLRGTSTPAVEHGLVVAGFANGKLVALSADKGFVGWETNIAIPQGRSELDRIVDIDGDPIIVGTAVYVTTYQGRIAVIDLQSGNPGWKRDMSSYVGLGVDFSQVYVTDAQSDVWALSRSTGATVWQTEDLANRRLTAPVPYNDYIAVGDYEGYVHLLSRYDGHIAGRVRVDSDAIRARPLVVDDILYVYSTDGKLAAYTLSEE
ncbi:MAG: outer membrane protein assembly factor BamB [Gammaproteobacteria bacterium]